MITRQSINVAVGSFIDDAFNAAGLQIQRLTSDDEAPVGRRSVRVQLGELQIDPMGTMRQLTQGITVFFYPKDKNKYRDDIWNAANAIEIALTDPLIVDGIALRCDDEGVVIDMTTEVMEIRFSLVWIEVANYDDEYELIETLEEELNYGTAS